VKGGLDEDADVVILTGSPLDPFTQVVSTLVNGDVVYSAEDEPPTSTR